MNRFKLLLVTLTLLAFTTYSNAYQLIQTPPATHKLMTGTFTPFQSSGGAVRYLEVVESSICEPELKLVNPSSTFTIPLGGTFKRFESPTGLVRHWPASFHEECRVPESGDVNIPPVPAVDFTGLSRISINPTPTDPNDCTFLEWRVTARHPDDTYTMQIIRWYDASQEINGRRVCPYN